MRTLISFMISVLISHQAVAIAPECPGFPTKEACLASVEQNLRDSLNLDQNVFVVDGNPERETLLMVSTREAQACLKTCAF